MRAGLRAAALAGMLIAVLAGCDEPPPPAPPPAPPSLVPADYPAGFSEVRDCRRSVEHGLVNILIRTTTAAAPLYREGPFPLPVGTLIVKEEYSGASQGCSERIGTTVMRKEPAGYDPVRGDWRWQQLDATGRVTGDGPGTGALSRCGSCHAGVRCRDFTCAEP
jgi:hypothetical protein